MNVITLPANCDRPGIVALIDPVAAALAQGAVTLDAGAVAKPGQMLLQFLLSARATGAAHGNGCTIKASPALAEMIALTGLDAALLEDAA